MNSQTSMMKRSASSTGVPAASAAKTSQQPLIEFPSSPQAAAGVGEEITHYIHSKHPLTEVNLPDLFTCSGCKEFGAGKRYACQQCDFQLHEFCALSPPLLKNHPLHGQHQLVFHPKTKPAKAGISWPKCDVCGKSTKGFTFRCRACSFQMHPCCAMLSNDISFPVHPHTLSLLPAYYSGDNIGVVCGECKKRRSGRMYHCTVCDYHIHAVCAKVFINGLQANGIAAPEKPSVLGTAARLASQVVIEFIGGLIEGLGEGIGDAIISSIGQGRRIRRRRSLNHE